MSRGAQRTTRQLTDQQLAQQNQLISQSNQQGTQDRSLLLPTINRCSPAPATRPPSNPPSRSKAWAPRTPPSTRSANAPPIAPPPPMTPPPLRELTAQLGREQAQSLASQAQQNQIAFANQRTKDQLAGLSALGQTYGIDTNLLGHAMGVPAQLLGVRQRASDGSSTGGLASLFGVGSSIASLFG